MKHTLPCFVLMFTALMGGCQRYSFSVNEHVVYTPPKLPDLSVIVDDTLRHCAVSSLEEKQLTNPEQLIVLQCPPGEIESLTGIEIMKGLQVLGLAGNRVISLAPVKNLAKLRRVNVQNNQIVDFSTLKSAQMLEYLDARENPGTRCESLPQVASLFAPSHCGQ